MGLHQIELESTRSHIAQQLLYLDGKPLSLEHYPMHYAIYDGIYRRTLLKTARQVAKSTTGASFIISDSIGTPFFKTYYISPSQEQTRKFSHTRIGKMLAYSPDVRKHFIDSKSIDNVLLRIMKNGSEMAFTYALDVPDRTRGYSADRCFFDEVQDMLYEPVVPVIEECMANSKYAYSMYAGTPKTFENTIEFLWSLSTQTEWVIKCSGCNKSTFIDSDKALGVVGPECLNCRKALNPRHGRWIDMKPAAGIKGFHISQPIMPENVPAAWDTAEEQRVAMERWDRIQFKREHHGEAQFNNEVLGISNSIGARLLTKEMLEELCVPDHRMTRLPDVHSLDGISRTTAGVDWSGGGGEVKGSEGLVKSRTVLHIWGEMPDGRLKTMFYKIFPNGHCTQWIKEIVELSMAWNVQMLCGDAGEGMMANALLREALGAHRVIQARYMALSKPIDWNPNTLTYHADRTTLIDNFAMWLKQKRAVYASVPEMTPAINDILSVYEETTMQGHKVWRHAPTNPDDSLHAQLFGWLAHRVLVGDLKFYS